MPLFEFQAKTEDGRIVKGELDAMNEAEARIRMRAQRLTPLRIEARKTGVTGFDLTKLNMFGDSVSQKDLQVFTRQFAVLVGAGVPIVQSNGSFCCFVGL